MVQEPEAQREGEPTSMAGVSAPGRTSEGQNADVLQSPPEGSAQQEGSSWQDKMPEEHIPTSTRPVPEEGAEDEALREQ